MSGRVIARIMFGQLCTNETHLKLKHHNLRIFQIYGQLHVPLIILLQISETKFFSEVPLPELAAYNFSPVSCSNIILD